MSSACSSVALGLIFTACLLKNSRALPIPTTPLPPLPRRFLDQPYEKDGFTPVDYSEPKRSLAQQSHEKAKKYSRNRVPQANEFFDNFYGSNPFNDPRGLVESNSIPQDGKYYNSYEIEGYFPDDEFSFGDEETNEIDSIYPGDPSPGSSNYGSEQHYPIEPNLLSSYQPGTVYPSIYIGGDVTSIEYDFDNDEDEIESTAVKEFEDEYDNGVSETPITTTAPPTTLQPTTPSSKSTTQQTPPSTSKAIPQQQTPSGSKSTTQQTNNKTIQKPPQQPTKQGGTVQLLSALDTVLGPDWDTGDLKVKEARTNKPISRINALPPQSLQQLAPLLPPPPTPLPPPPIQQEPKPKNIKETKQSTVDESATVLEKVPSQKEIFSRTTTITKTTSWYLNNNNEIVVVEDDDGKPQPLNVKYTRTSKTVTSGPVPWYLQGFEDVIFEEENGKSKTIIDKMAQLKGLNPTSITSFTTAPNPWSSEVHEEVVFEEIVNQYNESELKANYLGPHPSPLEHIVEYLPRSHSEEPDGTKDKIENKIEEADEDIIIEKVVPVDVVDKQPTPKPYLSHFHPPVEIEPEPEEDPPVPEYRGYKENHVKNELQNAKNPNLLTTQKPQKLTDSFTTNLPVTQQKSSEPNQFSQTSYLASQGFGEQQPQAYGNPLTPSNENPNAGNRREKWVTQPPNWENRGRSNIEYPDQQAANGFNNYPQPKIEGSPKERFLQDEPGRYQWTQQGGMMKMNQQDPKRQMYPNQQQFQNRQPRTPRDL